MKIAPGTVKSRGASAARLGILANMAVAVFGVMGLGFAAIFDLPYFTAALIALLIAVTATLLAWGLLLLVRYLIENGGFGSAPAEGESDS